MKKTIPKDAVLIPKEAECVFKGVIYDVYQWSQKQFDGSMATFEMLKRPDTVVTISIQDGKILAIDEEQPHARRRLSFPKGRVDEGELSVVAAAKREMLEETGYTFKNWRLIQVTQPAVKIEWFVYVWLAWDGEATAQPHLDAGEKITVQELSFAEVKSLVLDKVGYLGEAHGIFENLHNMDDLLALPEFVGQEVDR